MGKNFFVILAIVLFSSCSLLKEEDLGHTVLGDKVTNEIDGIKVDEIDPFIGYEGLEKIDQSEKMTDVKSDTVFLFSSAIEQQAESLTTNEFKDFPYSEPGTQGTSEYKEIDIKRQVRNFANKGENSIQIYYFDNNYSYKSPNNVIENTISNGYDKGRYGPLLFKYDSYVFKTFALNGFYQVGTGFTYNRGKGRFLDGTTSATTFKLWEIPLDLGLGLEIPIGGPWFKVSGAAGANITGLYQSRDDFTGGEKGKRKTQVGYGPYAEGVFKLNFSRLFPETAFSYFSESEITNISLNANLRYQNVSNFNDDISISGTSYGIGFGFEFL